MEFQSQIAQRLMELQRGLRVGWVRVKKIVDQVNFWSRMLSFIYIVLQQYMPLNSTAWFIAKSTEGSLLMGNMFELGYC